MAKIVRRRIHTLVASSAAFASENRIWITGRWFEEVSTISAKEKSSYYMCWRSRHFGLIINFLEKGNFVTDIRFDQ